MRKILLSLIAILAVTMSVSAQDVKLLGGQNIPVRLMTEINSKYRTQVAPYGIVDANIMDSKGENIVISRGTPVVMDIEIQRAKGVGKAGYIKINCVSTTAVDGQRINLIGTNIAQGDDRKGLAIGLGVGLGIVVCPPCFFCLCIKGENVVIPENTVLGNIVVNENYNINIE